jgi:hypothetical protein
LFLARTPGNAESDILFDGQPWENPVILKDKDPSRIGTIDGSSFHKNISCRLFQEPGHDIEEGRLTAPGRANNADKLTRHDLQVNRPQDFNLSGTLFSGES